MGTDWTRPAGRTVALAGVLLALASMAPSRAAQAPETGALGATAEGLVAAGRALSPALRAAALVTAATTAKAGAAGALDDPTFTATLDEVDRTGGRRINKTYLMFTQEFPLWGKRELRRLAALAAVDVARGRERAAHDELDERIKVAFARYHAVTQALAINQNVIRLTRQMAAAAERRYGQGVGDQSSAMQTRIEETRSAVEQIRLEAARTTSVARLNALLARPADTPLSKPTRARKLPATDLAAATLLERARLGDQRR